MLKKFIFVVLFCLSAQVTMAMPLWKIYEQGMLSAHKLCVTNHFFCGLAFLDFNLHPLGFVRFRHANISVLAYSLNNAATAGLFGRDTQNVITSALPGHINNDLSGFTYMGYSMIFYPGGYVFKLGEKHTVILGEGTVYNNLKAKSLMAKAVKKTMRKVLKTQTLEFPNKPPTPNVRRNYPLLALMSINTGLTWCDKHKLGCAITFVDGNGNYVAFLGNDRASYLTRMVSMKRGLGVISGVAKSYLAHNTKMRANPRTYRLLGHTRTLMLGGGIVSHNGVSIGGVGVAINVRQGGKVVDVRADEKKLQAQIIKFMQKYYLLPCDKLAP